jgi:hypothetical protein
VRGFVVDESEGKRVQVIKKKRWYWSRITKYI